MTVSFHGFMGVIFQTAKDIARLRFCQEQIANNILAAEDADGAGNTGALGNAEFRCDDDALPRDCDNIAKKVYNRWHGLSSL
ncbi:MAG TPA: hypothetical protein VME45_10280 [Stellaceae bacterium]|nr:hypothetical protein [Stellaceae bacterium]